MSSVIAMRANAPSSHPKRAELSLSRQGLALCEAGVRMASWGSAGAGRPCFVCPVEAKRLASCPLASLEAPGWRCEPDSRLGPTCPVTTAHHPRLFPEISRNNPTFHRLYALRSAPSVATRHARVGASCFHAVTVGVLCG
ncbi:MAG TPA: hypothetical protein ENK18_12585 [Deltaproteobacteria bacterium]|nr:hypothetical protein [Deltaproteobacteria bacterium]